MDIDAKMVMELRRATGAGMMDCKHALAESGGDLSNAKDFLRKKGLVTAQKKAGRATEEGGVAAVLSASADVGSLVQLACETDFVARNKEFIELLEHLAQQALQSTDNFSSQPAPDGQGDVKAYLSRAVSKLGENLNLVAVRRLQAPNNGVVEIYVHTNRRIGVLVSLGAAKVVPVEGLRSLGRDLAMHIAASEVNAIHPSEVEQSLLQKEREIFTAQAEQSGKPAEIVEKMVEGRLKKFVQEVSLLAQFFVRDPQTSVEQWLHHASQQLGAAVEVKAFIKLQV